MGAMTFGLRASAVALTLAVAGCGGGGGGGGDADSAGSNAGALETSPEATALGASRSGAKVGTLQRYQIDPTKVFVAGISSGRLRGRADARGPLVDLQGSRRVRGRGVLVCRRGRGCHRIGELWRPDPADRPGLVQQHACCLPGLSRRAVPPSAPSTRPATSAGSPFTSGSGTEDRTVHPLEMADLNTQYERLGAKVRFDHAFPAAHGWESPDGELACGTLGSPFMVSCSTNGVAYDSVQTWAHLIPWPVEARATTASCRARSLRSTRPSSARRRTSR